ncbi:hypothetical protein [Treponema putidum]|uniref:Uncharacterized protein n=1 Tax=Treponema putidum TaxID=221027 RepID=A0AAE9SL91_9SPIR|nr:hypothetical protein [Treponema putidum]AIN94563.1 hypothetical protein JO40_11065 [Treponema putidum]TWI78837.1 hypothetical protein JM98_00418 [Treponema putidum]UTY28573.1 hypothetical protein E4N76_05895 [Treponema putidum]UTY31020.1 hypothetical protein E4N75_05375 [Treponema putidum]UTY33439.1 hypothetical protein E4N74_04985 [Treponema putidum]
MLKRKKRFLIIFLSVSSLFFIIFGSVSFYNYKLGYIKQKLSKSNLDIHNTGTVIKTFGQNTETVSAVISFFTPRGYLINSYERAWHGWELNLECVVFTFKSGSVVFPYRLFSNESKYGTGVKLFDYYNRKGYPAIYDYSFFSDEEKSLIKTLYKYTMFSPYLLKVFSYVNIKTVSLRNFRPDTEYLLYAGSDGEIKFIKN